MELLSTAVEDGAGHALGNLLDELLRPARIGVRGQAPVAPAPRVVALGGTPDLDQLGATGLRSTPWSANAPTSIASW